MGLNKRLIGAGATASGALTPSENFKAVLYTGNGGTQAITGVGFQPDFVWIKQRDAVRGQNWYDSTRGVENVLFSNSTGAASQETAGTSLGSFDTDGFTVGTGIGVNASGGDFVAWCWKANGGTTTSVTGTNISSATQQVNTDIDFSITQFTEGSSGTSAVPHGLSGTPDMYIVKRTGGTQDWYVWHNGLSAGNSYIILNSTAAQGSNNNMWTQVDSTNINLGAWNTEGGGTKIVYAFKNVDSFSKFGSYTGNGSANGPIVETGFEPAFIMVKNTTSSGQDWRILDNKRNTSNPRNCYLSANNSNAEECQYDQFDFLSNGFQVITTDGSLNQNTSNFIYMAFAADPDTEAPTLADSFNIKTYTGNGSSNSITGLGFKPGLIWMKRRDTAQEHALVNIVSGPLKHLYSDLASAEQTTTNGVSSFNDDGWTMGANGLMNNTNNTYVGWAWKADDNEPTIFPPNQTVADIKSTNLTLNLNLAAGSYSGSGSAIEDLSSAEEDFTVTNASVNEGYGGYYIDFDGSGDYADSDSSIATTTGNDITIEFWVRSESGSQPSYADIMDANHGTAVAGSSGQGWAIQMRGANQNSFYFVYYDGSGYQSNSDGEIFELTTDKWTHIAIVKSGTSVQVYEDGVAGNSWTASSATLENPNQIIRLAGWLAGGRDFNGSLGQVRLYSDALSAGEVLGNYNATKGLFTVTESIVSANANAGFSVVKWTGTGSAGKVPHGLSAAPEMIITKRLNSAGDWYTYHKDLNSGTNPAYNFIKLNSSDAEIVNASSGGSIWNSTSPSSTVINVGTTLSASTSDSYIAYCFHSVSGYQKLGGYSGNGSGSGQTITTGFQPDWIILKCTNIASEWVIVDSVRGDAYLLAESDGAEVSPYTAVDFLSTGFKLTGTSYNNSGRDFIYMAIKIN
jgi:hypothetical protein